MEWSLEINTTTVRSLQKRGISRVLVTNLSSQAPFSQSCSLANHDLFHAVCSSMPDLNQDQDRTETKRSAYHPPSRHHSDTYNKLLSLNFIILYNKL